MREDRLLSVLVCPETRQALRLAQPDLVAALNRKIEAGQLMNRAGEDIRLPLEKGLMREDGKVLYPVRRGIPVLLLDEAIALDEP